MNGTSARLRLFFVLAILFAFSARIPAYGQAQEQSAAQASATSSSDKVSTENSAESNQRDPNAPRFGHELAKETREAEGEEKNSNLTHSAVVRKLGNLLGLNVHQAHMLALWLNFAIVLFLIFWFGRKSIPAMFRKRSDSIQQALAEARKASEEANRRLADIEGRLGQMDVEIGSIRGSAEKEAEAEESRIKQAAEEEIRKVVQAAEQEIAAAAKQARRDLSTHTADLAIALARKQINVDSNTDQVLVRDFAAKLGNSSTGGKDGR